MCFSVGPDWEKRIITVSRGALEGKRFDPSVIFGEKDKSESTFEKGVLRDLVHTKTGGTPSKDNPEFWIGNIPWVSPKDFKGLSISDSEDHISELAVKKSSTKLIQKGSIIVVFRSGILAHTLPTAITKEDVTINQDIKALIKKSENLNMEYLNYYFHIFQNEILSLSRKHGATVHSLNSEEFLNLQIPLPPLEIQEQLVQLMDQAIETKQRLETEADDMLAGVDDWILGELGIEKGEKNEKKVFTININDLDKDSRIDPFHYTKEGKFSSNKYPIDILGNVAKVEKGQALSSSDLVEGNIPVIAGGQSSPYNHNILNYSGNIITVSASGAYSGFVWYHENPIFASDCSVIFSNNEDILSTKFIAYYLRSRQRYIYSLQKGAGQPHVYPNDLKEIQIPLPPLSEQERISEHISSIIETARAKREEAKKVYEEAREKVEGLILGD